MEVSHRLSANPRGRRACSPISRRRWKISAVSRSMSKIKRICSRRPWISAILCRTSETRHFDKWPKLKIGKVVCLKDLKTLEIWIRKGISKMAETVAHRRANRCSVAGSEAEIGAREGSRQGWGASPGAVRWSRSMIRIVRWSLDRQWPKTRPTPTTSPSCTHPGTQNDTAF